MDKNAVIATLQSHRRELEKLGVVHAGLFGSLARGEAGPDSDIDIVVELDENSLPGVYAFVGMAQYIESLFEGRVDVVDRRAVKAPVLDRVEADLIDAF
jgi:predicted nucleotidyltransferase